jgi:hypothetical protein
MLWLPFAGSGLRHSHKYCGGIAKLFSPGKVLKNWPFLWSGVE